MAAEDISRSSTDYRKHYAGVRMQQGRVIIDDDWNENERLDNEDRRRTRVDIIGPQGTPDNGFRIANPRIENGTVNFDILPGSFYLGGLRLEMEEQPAPEVFLTQNDALQRPEPLPPAPTKKEGERYDLVYLEAWQQPVTATEDNEILEKALGGPDTSTRVRTMRRVLIKEQVKSDDCIEVWKQFVQTFSRARVLNYEGELIPYVKLTVDYEPDGVAEDLCRPSLLSGYLGAENQAIRVQIVDATHFTWGFDNASPIYRIQINKDENNNTIVQMITRPKDQAHWPLAGQIVEILPWGAVLPNGEKVATLTGHLSRIKSSYDPVADPEKPQFVIETPLPSNFDRKWIASSRNDHFYMRVWNRGADLESSPKIPYSPGTKVRLGKTGLMITMSGRGGLPGDHWIIAARPETPNKVVPWRLEEGMSPQGVRRFYAPLAIIHWSPREDGKTMVGEVSRDCRKRFRPLTQYQGCCSLTVGDGKTSHGDFDSIEEALKHLPSTGGEICLMPGVHEANVHIKGKRNITIRGCGNRTTIIPRGGHLTEPIIYIVDSQGILVEQVEMIAMGGKAVLMEGPEQGKLQFMRLFLRDIEIRHTRILAFDCAIHTFSGSQIKIHHNVIRMLDKEGAGVAIYVMGRDVLIEGNDIGVIPAESTPPGVIEPGEEDPANPCANVEDVYGHIRGAVRYAKALWNAEAMAVLPKEKMHKALGGIHVYSGSKNVKICSNKIIGGAGNGISLGHEIEITTDGAPEQVIKLYKYTYVQVVDERGNPLESIAVAFKNDAGQHSLLSHEDGRLDTINADGEFTVSILSPGWVIKHIEKKLIDEAHCKYKITLKKFEGSEGKNEPEKIKAPIQKVDITDNEITNMGLCGIGTPQNKYSLAMLYLSNPNSRILKILPRLSNISITLNRITGCVNSPITMDIRRKPRNFGFGPISLGWCTFIIVKDNQILQNGTTTKEPVYGMLILGTYIDIVGNVLAANGALIGELRLDYPALRGGIIAIALETAAAQLSDSLAVRTEDYQLKAMSNRAAAASAAGTTSAPTKPDEKLPYVPQVSVSDIMPAISIHNNTVQQPIGCTLMITAIGAVSVTDNYLHTVMSDPSTGGLGAVFILNAGRSTTDAPPLQKPASSVNPSARVNGNEYIETIRSSSRKSGHVLFANNHTILDLARRCRFSQIIHSSDDIGFHGNQSDVLDYDSTMKGNTWLKGMLTVRAADSRFKEAIKGMAKDQDTGTAKVMSLYTVGLVAARAIEAEIYISLLTMALVNNTTHNQGDHCIIVTGTKRIDNGNQVLFPVYCEQLKKDIAEIENKLSVISRLRMAMSGD